MKEPRKNTGTERLADIIDFEKDIAPYNLIQLVAGVGAGKNYWACELANQGYRVLLITSRRATADAQAKKMNAGKWFDFDSLFKNENVWGTVPGIQKKAICTNRQIEYFVKEWYDPDEPKTHVWNYFDFIFLDEAHSLSSDATFTDSPFYVERFLKYAYKQNKNCKIIVMTGTPEPIDWLFAKSKKVHKLDYFNKCTHVEPPKVYFCPSSQVLGSFISYYKKNKRVVYFVNSTKEISKLVKQLKENGVPEEAIGIGYTKKEADERFSEDMLTAKEKIRKSLVEEEKLPDEIKIFITTSKNKEGININDDDIFAVIAESHIHADLTQMIGRIRNGVQYFCIIYDAFQHGSREDFIMEYVSGESADVVAESATRFIKTYGRNKKAENIKKIEERYRYVKYDILSEKFYAYTGRIEGEYKARRDKSDFAEYIEYVNEPCNEYGETGFELLQEWFPYSKIAVYLDDDVEAGLKKLQNEVDVFMTDNEFLGKVINHDTYNNILEVLNSTVIKYSPKIRKGIKVPARTLGPLAKKFGYRVEPRRNGENFIITKIIDDE